MMRIKNGAEMQLTVYINMGDGYHIHAVGTHVTVTHPHIELDEEGYVPPAPMWVMVTTKDGKTIGVRHCEIEPRK